jgi:hypothetical protein
MRFTTRSINCVAKRKWMMREPPKASATKELSYL